MIKRHYILVLALLCLFTTLKGQIADAINLILTNDPISMDSGLAIILKEKKVKTFPLLNAINDKKLFLYKNQLVVAKELTEEENSEGKLNLLSLYPKNEVLKDANEENLLVDKSEIKEVNFSRKSRLTLLPMLPYMNLVSEDLEKRKLSFVQFQQKGTAEDIQILNEAKELETDPFMIRMADETSLAIQLYSSKTDAETMSIVDKLMTNLGDNTEYILSKYLKQLSPESPIFKEIEAKRDSLISRANRIGVVQNIFSGLSLGSILIMIALGLSIIYGLAGVINMAHGEFIMIGAYTTYILQKSMGSMVSDNLIFVFALPCAFIMAGIFGLIIERLILRKLYNSPLESLLATWGISLVFIQIARTIFGDLTSVKTPSLLAGGLELVPQLVLPYNRIFIIVVTVLLIVGVYLFLYKSTNGLRIRSVTQNRDMSSCLGISTKKIDALTFFIGSGMAGLAGCCITLIGNVVPDMGQTYVVDSFLVVVTGGVGNLFGSVIAGLGIGQFTKAIEPVFHAVYGKVVILVVIILFLQFKPRGLFPAKGRIAEE